MLLTYWNGLACAMCLGGASGELADAANVAIGLMLVVLTLVLSCFLAFIVFLGKRSKLVEEEEARN